MKIFSISPIEGRAGDRFTLSGSGIDDDASVSFGTVESDSDESFGTGGNGFSGSVPAGSGIVDIRATNPNGKSAVLTQAFTYLDGILDENEEPAEPRVVKLDESGNPALNADGSPVYVGDELVETRAEADNRELAAIRPSEDECAGAELKRREIKNRFGFLDAQVELLAKNATAVAGAKA